MPDMRLMIAQQRGIKVHRACFAIAKGCWALVDEEAEPYVQSFKIWVENVVEKIVYVGDDSGPGLIDEEFGFIGHPDIIVTLKRECHPRVIDLKTPITKTKIWRLQLAAYSHLAMKAGWSVDISGSLRLSPNGEIAKFDASENWHRDFAVFLSALNIYRFMMGG